MSPIDFSHREQSFAVRSWQDMFQKLRFELDEFETTRSSDRIMAARSYRALNLAWTAWHIHDWFFEDRIDAGDHNLVIVKSVFPDVDFAVKRRKRERLTLFGDQLASRFQALSICRTLATAGKHGKAEARPMPELRAHDVCPIPGMEGPLGPICWDVRILMDNMPWDARDLFIQAVADWVEFFGQIGEKLPQPGDKSPPKPASVAVVVV